MNKWKELSGGVKFTTTRQDKPRVNAELKDRKDIKELARDVLTRNLTKKYIREQIQGLNIEELQDTIMLLVDHYNEKLKKHGEIILDLLNNYGELTKENE